MLGEAAEKLGFASRDGRGVGAPQAGDAGAAKEVAEEAVPVTALKNRAGESRSPYVSCAPLSCRCWYEGCR